MKKNNLDNLLKEIAKLESEISFLESKNKELIGKFDTSITEEIIDVYILSYLFINDYKSTLFANVEEKKEAGIKILLGNNFYFDNANNLHQGFDIFGTTVLSNLNNLLDSESKDIFKLSDFSNTSGGDYDIDKSKVFIDE